jgi:CO dehydrogenase maturation factor
VSETAKEEAMKIMICGKGGSGKSTVTALLARALTKCGKKVLVVDADESNLCLHRLLGARLPEVLMDAMGGRKGVKEQLKPTLPGNDTDSLLKESMTLDDLPHACLAEAEGGVKLLVVGKIVEYGEGCACLIGSISKAILTRLRESADEVILIDAEAGLEHFGRRVDAGCDLVLSVVDPSYESVTMADRIRQLADGAGVQAYVILNKVDAAVREVMVGRLDPERLLAAIPRDDQLFMQSLHGQALTAEIAEIDKVCRFIENYRKPVSLALSM